MNYSDLSDLEEGEIFECDSLSSEDSRSEDFEIRSSSFKSSKNEKDTKENLYELKKEKDICFFLHKKDGYVNDRLKEKLHLHRKVGNIKSNHRMRDLESISSEGEYKSDEEDKFSASETEYYLCSNSEIRKKEKHSTKFYGTVEDIMCEIEERICRKSHCNYKKKKSKYLKHDSDKYSDSSHESWSRKIFSSHLKHKKRKRKVNFCDSDSDRAGKRKKRKAIYYEGIEKPENTLKRDFDEMRRNLLEKLKKQKAEAESKASSKEPVVELQNPEIQEVDMIIDCTNYVDNPIREKIDNEQGGSVENEEEDELDLTKLRLIALESKKKPKNEEHVSPEKMKTISVEKSSFAGGREVQLDRLDKHELLLRTEALKTAFLKKHQKRLKNRKVENPIEVGNSNGNCDIKLSSARVEEENLEKDDGKLTANGCTENLMKEKECDNGAPNSSDVFPAQVLFPVITNNNTPGENGLVTNGSSKSTHWKAKTKRKKKKSVSLVGNFKENNEKEETFEEDDRTLRTQLLSDLMKKKSLKDVEKKSVLMDSIQTLANKPEPPKENEKRLPVAKRNLPRNAVNADKTGKLMAVPIFPKPEIQRIIIHLGSDDSSDEDCDPFQGQNRQISMQKKAEEHEGAAVELSHEDKKTKGVTLADYERSVELLLNQTRKKIEGEKRTAITTTFATDEAIYKHLMPSQNKMPNLRKQKKGSFTVPQSSKIFATKGGVSQNFKLGIAEKLDLKPINSSSRISPLKNYSGLSRPEVVRNCSLNINNSRLYTDLSNIKSKERNHLIINEKNKLPGISGKVSNKYLAQQAAKRQKPVTAIKRNTLILPSNQVLISKLKLLKKKKTIENYEKEILKLKNQLSLFEKKKCEQRFKKMMKPDEESIKSYNAIQDVKENEREEEKIKDGHDDRSKEDEGVKKAEVEETWKGKNVSDEPETEINKAQSETSKVLSDNNKISENVADGTATCSRLVKYDSPLQTFSESSDQSKRVDPNVMMCQFDLMGVCKDEECTYQHLRVS